MRRHDVDWVRVYALGLLILYHAVLGFMPDAKDIYFIGNEQTLEGLWVLMGMINVWRIPIVFMVSGMGVYFAMEHRAWKALLQDRTLRILVPLIFGSFFIAPISFYFAMKYYGMEVSYWANPAHLWFLANIYLYVILLLPLLSYLKSRPENGIVRFLTRAFRHPAGLYLLAVPIVVEALLVQPENYTVYYMNLHGFLLGMACFLTGFLFVSLKEVSWQAVQRVRTVALALAFLLYLVRLLLFKLEGPNALIAFESMSWMLAIFGYASVYLNKPSAKLNYLSKAVYPVYIVHLPMQFFFSYYIMTLALPALVKLVVLLSATYGASFLLYELAIKRIKWIRPLFGMKLRPADDSVVIHQH
jgi:glucan biosynthesis protein C